eukprot:jgi/Undpi1/6435/HiC_scaffold_20.g08916.m1
MAAPLLSPPFTAGGWVWIDNFVSIVHQGSKKNTDAIVLKTNLSLNWNGPFKIFSVDSAPASDTPVNHPLQHKLLSINLPTDLPGRDFNRRVANERCKPCRNPDDIHHIPNYLPSGLTAYAHIAFAAKLPPYHMTLDDISTPPERLGGEQIMDHQLVRGRDGVIAVLYKTHWAGFLSPSWERELDLQRSRCHILLYWSDTPTQHRQANRLRIPTDAPQRELSRSQGQFFLALGEPLSISIGRFGAPPQFSKSTAAVPDMLADWLLTAAPGFERGQEDNHELVAKLPRVTEDYGVDILEALEAAVTYAPNSLTAIREARAWREVIAPSQGSVGHLPGITHARHLLGLIGCCPSSELEDMFPSLARELLGLLRRGGGEPTPNNGSKSSGSSCTRVIALAAVDEAVRRLLEATAPPAGGGGGAGRGGGGGGGGAAGSGRNSKVGGGEVGGARQVLVAVLPKLVPAVTACLHGSTSPDGACSFPPDPAVGAGALGVLEALVSLLRSTMRPHVKKVEDATALWLQGPSDVVRDRAAAVLASLPLCGEAEAWTQAAGRVALEAHGLLHKAWPDGDVDMGSDLAASRLEEMQSAAGGLLPPLGGTAAVEGFEGPQQAFAAIVARRFKGLCRVLELMLAGDSNGRPVAVPVVLIIALVERVQRMASVSRGQGPQIIRPALDLAASRLLHALATTAAPTVMRNGRRFCRALVQGVARSSAAGTLRAAGYRSVGRAMLQLGAGAAPYLATPALPALLEEIRAMIISSDPSSAKASTQGEKTPLRGSGVSGTGGGGGGGGKGGMRIEPAMSARKSSQKKLRRSREKEASRALSAANAAATLATSGDGAVRGGSGGGSTAGGGSGLRGGCIWTGEAASAEREAVCASLWCLTQVVLCCKGHLPLGGRLAVEDVLHQGLEILAHSAGATGGGGGGAGGIGGDRGSCSRLDDPRVAREFLGLARACLMTPLADGTRSSGLSIAVTAFRSLRSHPDQHLAAASRQAQEACGAILYPRAAPLHLPHAVTSQARAWGASSVGRQDVPLGWGGTLGSNAEGDESNDAMREVESDDESDGQTEAAAVQNTAVVASSSKSTTIDPPRHHHRGSDHQKPPVTVSGGAVEIRGGETIGEVESQGEGRGKGKGSQWASGDNVGIIAASSSQKSHENKGNTGSITGSDIAGAAFAVGDKQAMNTRRKRPRDDSEVVVTGEEGERSLEEHRQREGGAVAPGNNAACEEREEEEEEEKEEEEEAEEEVDAPPRNMDAAAGRANSGATAKQESVSPAAAPSEGGAGYGGVGGSEHDEGEDDDDGFDFPPIVDADPDVE